MAEVTVKKCDVFGTYKDVREVEVTVSVGSDCDPTTQQGDRKWAMDACPKAYDRLIRFLERGVKPPTGRKQEPTT